MSVIVLLAVLIAIVAGLVWVTGRLETQRAAQIAAAPIPPPVALAWPVEPDDDSATPYLRGATNAGALFGRR